MEYRIINDKPLNISLCSDKLTLHRYKLVTTFFFFLVWINLGVTNCVISSTLPDFRHRLGIKNEEFGRLMLVVVVVATTLSISGGILADRFRSHVILILAVVQLVSAFGHGLIPWSVSVYMAGAMFVVRNSAHQACNALGSAYIVAMWDKDASFYIHFLHMGYPVGCILGPIIAGPYLSQSRVNHTDDTNTTTPIPESSNSALETSTAAVDGFSLEEQTGNSSIEIPYAIGSICLCFTSFLFCLLYFDVIKRPKNFSLQSKDKKSIRDVCDPRSCAGGRAGFGVTMIAMFFLYYALLVACEGVILNTFLFTYAVEGPFKFSNQQANRLDIAFKASQLVGRLLILPLASRVKVQILLFVEVTGSFIASIGLATLGTQEPMYLWIFACLYNAFIGPSWPGGYAWFDRYVILYTIIISLSDVFKQLSAGVPSWLVGYILDSNHPNNIWKLLLLLTGALLALLPIGQVTAYRHGERFALRHRTRKDSSCKDDENCSMTEQKL